MDDVSSDPDRESLFNLYNYYKFPGDYNQEDVKKLFEDDFEEKVICLIKNKRNGRGYSNLTGYNV